MPRDTDESRSVARWSEPSPAPGDPHRDVTGALHDVSNALTVMLGWVAEAREGRSSPERVERALSIVERHARTARGLARQAIGAQAVFDDREESLDAVVAEVVEALLVEAQRSGVAIRVSGQTADVRVPQPGDASQVLTNVLLNALAWSPAGTEVHVDKQADGTVALVFVQDEGPGVPAALAPVVFEGSTQRPGGAGVGLRHARAVARAAGGDLELLPELSTPGARFRLRWPRVEATLPRASMSAPRPPVLAGTRILVVEDDADVAALLESSLEARGAHVVVVRNARELAAHSSETHDAALVDLSPIAADVRGAVEALRRGSPNLALVFISGSAVGLPDGVEVEGERVRWVRKPFEVAEIVAVLAETSASAARAAAARRGPA